MKTTMTWVLTTALVVGAWLVAASTPKDDAYVEPFPVPATIGEPADGRTFVVTVQDVRAAGSVTAGNGWAGEGTWIVVDLDISGSATPMSFLPAHLAVADLVIGGRTYSASERPPSLRAHELVPGVPYSGVVVFEIPDDALEGIATLRLASNTDPRGDTVVELSIPLEELDMQSEIELAATEWTRS